MTPPPPQRSLLARFAGVALLFLPMAAVGTITHELGHIVAAHALGCDPVLHYASTDPNCGGRLPPGDQVIAVLSGPLQTMLTGTIGLALLWWLRRRRRDETMSRSDWIATLLSLFWSRELFNAAGLAVMWALELAPPHHLRRGDEQRLSLALELPMGVIPSVTAALGLAACLAVVALLPRSERGILVLGGATGSLLGFAIWMQLLGPILLP